MNQIQIITDAGSDLTVLPMTIRFGEEEYLDGVNLTHKQFYEKMIETQVLPTTSQPSPYAFETAIRKIHEQGDIALIITISSKLSGTWQSANIAAAETGGEVYIVDSLNVAVGEKAIVEYALRMKDAGTDIHTIVDTLNREKENLRVIALLDTLEYLQKGGRISKTVAIAGSLLSIKPVVSVVDGEVALLGKARGSRQGNNFLIQVLFPFPCSLYRMSTYWFTASSFSAHATIPTIHLLRLSFQKSVSFVFTVSANCPM